MFDSQNLNILYDTYYIMLYLMAGNLEVKLPSNGQSGANSEKKKFSTKKIREEKEPGKREQEERRSTCEKRGKNRETVFFQCFGAPDGRKLGALKRRVGSYLVR
jgi:hypothetical protein